MTDDYEGDPYDDQGPQPANSLDAEMSVLGAMISSPRAVVIAMDVLQSSDFYWPKHATIFRGIIAVADAGNPVDPVTMTQHLLAQFGSEERLLERIGGAPYLHTLFEKAATNAGSVEYHARIVRTKAALRRLAEAGMQLQDMARRPVEVDLLAVHLERARAIVDEATTEFVRRGDDEGVWISDLAEESLARWAEPKPPAMPTGWHDLDALLDGGLQPGTLTVIAARPSVGKSLLAVQLAVTVALNAVIDVASGVLFASLEMPRAELADRIMSQLTKVPLTNLTRHELTEDDWNRVRYWSTRLRDVPLRIEDAPHMSMAKLRGHARDLTRHKAGCGLVVADYVQLMQPADRRISREQQVSAFSRELKLLAKELHCPVVALSQLNRKVEERQTPKPVLSDLRESGAIEQDADKVFLLWDDPQKEGERQISVAKNRQGRKGDVSLAWRPWVARADSLGLHAV